MYILFSQRGQLPNELHKKIGISDFILKFMPFF